MKPVAGHGRALEARGLEPVAGGEQQTEPDAGDASPGGRASGAAARRRASVSDAIRKRTARNAKSG